MKSRTKIITAATAACVGVAMVSVGFASWVIAVNVPAGQDGNIVVETVSNESVIIEAKITENTAGNIAFTAPETTDQNAWLHGEDNTPANLVASIDVKVTAGAEATFGGKVYLTIDAITDSNWLACVRDGYISGDVTVTIGDSTTALDATNGAYAIDVTETAPDSHIYTATVKVTYAWGTHFEGQNPYDYYKNKTATEPIADGSTTLWYEDAETALEAIEAIGNNVTYSYHFNATAPAPSTGD